MVRNGGIDVLISAFVHYTELSSVKYEAKEDIIKIEILLNAQVDDITLTRFIERARQCMKVYFDLSSTVPAIFNIDYTRTSGITLLKIHRDSGSLSEKEMELYVLLLREEFDSILVKENASKMSEKNCKQRILKTLVKDEKEGLANNTLFAYRDEGTMFVFNK